MLDPNVPNKEQECQRREAQLATHMRHMEQQKVLLAESWKNIICFAALCGLPDGV